MAAARRSTPCSAGSARSRSSATASGSPMKKRSRSSGWYWSERSTATSSRPSTPRPGPSRSRGGARAELAEEILLSVDFYMAQPEARWVGEVVLSGPGARREGLADQLGSMIDVPGSGAEPLGRLQSTQVPVGEDPYRHTVAVGLALGATA